MTKSDVTDADDMDYAAVLGDVTLAVHVVLSQCVYRKQIDTRRALLNKGDNNDNDNRANLYRITFLESICTL